LAFVGQSEKNLKIKVSEIFYSLQGEGRFVGVPSVFLRTFGCNFTCSGFGCRTGERSDEADEIATVAHMFNRFEDLPLVTTGCDSYASWHPAFKELSASETTQALVSRMTGLIPNNKWAQPNGNDIHLVITGGEPLLGWQRAYPELLENSGMRDLENLTFETNGTQTIDDAFADYLHRWSNGYAELTFSVSPKLSASGEAWSEAIRPTVVASYQDLGRVYLKFVVETEQHFEEVNQAVSEYRAAGFVGKVYVMPQGGVVTPYEQNRVRVADWALAQGYNYSPRMHVDLWGNGWGK
jgi:organic radical activating enzyme